MILTKEQQQQMGIICNLIMQINAMTTKKVVCVNGDYGAKKDLDEIQFIQFNLMSSIDQDGIYPNICLTFFKKDYKNFSKSVYFHDEIDISATFDYVINFLRSVLNDGYGVFKMSCGGVKLDG